jgi:CDP-4-dehydro-6-deoxyglucose reductase
MAQPWITCKVINIQLETPTVKRFWLEFEAPFHFVAGQFLTLDLPISDKKNKRMKSYSIASAPDNSCLIELVIVVVPEGEGGSLYMFNDVEVGTTITARGPIGSFILPESLTPSIYLIATGTGIAPFRSYLYDILQRKLTFTNIHLIFGTRTKADLLYYNEMTELASKLPNFTYTPVLSRADDAWDGAKGYVHEVYERYSAGNPSALFYLCGWKNMIDEARTRLTQLGFDKQSVHFEIYG